VFDPVRKKHVILTPEEIVRQGVIQYLIQIAQYPVGNISVEKKITVNGMTKRYDLVVYSAAFSPSLLVECKSEDVVLNEAVCKQIAIYNLQLKVPFLWLTNGKQHYILKFDVINNSYTYLQTPPAFGEL